MSLASAAGYTAGQCTWYVAKAFDWVGQWGDAWMWADKARADGRSISSTPVVGSIAVWGRGNGADANYGHVAIVQGIQANGLPTVSEMNARGAFVQDVRSIDAASARGIVGYILPPGGSGGTPVPSSTGSTGSSAPAPTSGGCRKLADFLSDTPGSSIPVVGAGVTALGAPVELFRWMAQPCIWQRALIVAAAVGVLVLGVTLLFHKQAEAGATMAARSGAAME